MNAKSRAQSKETGRGRSSASRGTAVLDEPANLPERAEVKAEIRAERARRPTLGEKLLKYAGMFTDLPRDLARNHDHYLHGTPKR